MTNPWVSWQNRSTVIGVSHVLFVNCELIHEGNGNCFWPPGSMKGQWLLLSLPSSQPANDGWQSYANGQDVWGRRLPYTEWRGEPAILMTDKSHGKCSFRSEWNQKGRNKWHGFVQLYSVGNAPPPLPSSVLEWWMVSASCSVTSSLKMRQRQTSHAQWNWSATFPASSNFENPAFFWILVVKCWQLAHVSRLDSGVTSALENASWALKCFLPS